jgi:hypothetical protein
MAEEAYFVAVVMIIGAMMIAKTAIWVSLGSVRPRPV